MLHVQRFDKFQVFSSIGEEARAQIGGIWVYDAGGPLGVVCSVPLLKDTIRRYFLKANGESELFEFRVVRDLARDPWETGVPPYPYKIELT